MYMYTRQTPFTKDKYYKLKFLHFSKNRFMTTKESTHPGKCTCRCNILKVCNENSPV